MSADRKQELYNGPEFQYHILGKSTNFFEYYRITMLNVRGFRCWITGCPQVGCWVPGHWSMARSVH